MHSKRFDGKKPRALCAETGPDDGADPRVFFSHERNRGRPNRKALQLCGQVADVLNLVLSGECGDGVLAALHVVSVVPAPDAAQLLVVVAPIQAGEAMAPAEVLARLDRASGMLRAAVAAAITRRRAPRLTFRYAPAEGRP